MNGRIVELLKQSASKSWKKKGSPYYRFLLIDDSSESEEAIRFMEDLGLAYTVQYLAGEDNQKRIKLPAITLAYGKRFQGLDAIKCYGKMALSPWSRDDFKREEKEA
jgi:hypothetical protein